MINKVIDFCAYGTMLEDYYKLDKYDLMKEEEIKTLSSIIDNEIAAVSNEKILELYKEKFRESVDAILGK